MKEDEYFEIEVQLIKEPFMDYLLQKRKIWFSKYEVNTGVYVQAFVVYKFKSRDERAVNQLIVDLYSKEISSDFKSSETLWKKVLLIITALILTFFGVFGGYLGFTLLYEDHGDRGFWLSGIIAILLSGGSVYLVWAPFFKKNKN
jgi:hypothetical protein